MSETRARSVSSAGSTEVTKGLERQRDEWMSALDRRVAELEADVRRRLEELGADADAERGVLEARLQELMRRLDATSAVQSSSVEFLRSRRQQTAGRVRPREHELSDP